MNKEEREGRKEREGEEEEEEEGEGFKHSQAVPFLGNSDLRNIGLEHLLESLVRQHQLLQHHRLIEIVLNHQIQLVLPSKERENERKRKSSSEERKRQKKKAETKPWLLNTR